MASKKNTRKSPRKSFPAWAWLLIAAAAVGIVYLVLQQGDASTEKLPRAVSVAEAAALREEGALILDVREQSEWDQGHIEGATLIPLGQLFSVPRSYPLTRLSWWFAVLGIAARRAGISWKRQVLRPLPQ